MITTAQKTELATVTHEDYYSWVPYGLRLGFLQHDKYVFKNNDGDFKRKAESIVAFYFGFGDWVAARRFEAYIRKKCMKLNAYHSHCVVREATRLSTAFEVKCRNVDFEVLSSVFRDLMIKEYEKGSIEFDYEAVSRVLSEEELKRKAARF